MFIDRILNGTSSVKNTSLITMVFSSLLISLSMVAPANSAKVYHCLQANGTKAFQGRPCEKDKKEVAVTEQKNTKAPAKQQDNDTNVIGKWTLNGISSSVEGEKVTQEETISWTFDAEGKVTYQYQANSVVYDYTVKGNVIELLGSSIGSFTIVKNEGDSAVWQAGSTYYFLTLSSVI